MFVGNPSDLNALFQRENNGYSPCTFRSLLARSKRTLQWYFTGTSLQIPSSHLRRVETAHEWQLKITFLSGKLFSTNNKMATRTNTTTGRAVGGKASSSPTNQFVVVQFNAVPYSYTDSQGHLLTSAFSCSLWILFTAPAANELSLNPADSRT